MTSPCRSRSMVSPDLSFACFATKVTQRVPEMFYRVLIAARQTSCMPCPLARNRRNSKLDARVFSWQQQNSNAAEDCLRDS